MSHLKFVKGIGLVLLSAASVVRGSVSSRSAGGDIPGRKC